MSSLLNFENLHVLKKLKIARKPLLLVYFLLKSLCFAIEPTQPIDWEEWISTYWEHAQQDFVLENKQIFIPEYPTAFNPSIVRWKNRLIMSFRVIPDRKASFHSLLGVILLNEDFTPASSPQILPTRSEISSVPSRAEDGRLIVSGDDLYIVYDDHPDPIITKGGFRVFVARLDFDNQIFTLQNPECLSQFEGASPLRREKNWVPFSYDSHLLLAYSLIPHLIFLPALNTTGDCISLASSRSHFPWTWGIPRGGTPALLLNNEKYLAFFHSSSLRNSPFSPIQPISHYFMGAYLFNSHPPFTITHISPCPIMCQGFYSGTSHQPYWKPVRVVFPGGYLLEDPFIWIFYGRQDHEIWAIKLDKQKLLNSLISIDEENT